MKKIIALFCLGLLLVNCSNDDEPIVDKLMEIVEADVEMGAEEVTASTASFKGDFVSAAHPTSGKALVSKNKSTLALTNFKTDNGPKLLVYLSTDANATEYVNLGDLKGIDGDYSYDIPYSILLYVLYYFYAIPSYILFCPS